MAQNTPEPDAPPRPAAEYDPKAWKEYSSRQGRFSILFPGRPSEEDTSFDTAAGRLEARQYKLATSAYYIVDYTDFPLVLEQEPGKLNQTFNSIRDGAVANAQGKVLSESDLRLEGHPGRELKIAIPDGGIIRVRMYAVGQRIYQTAVTTPKELKAPDGGRFDEARALKFLDSLKLISTEEGAKTKP